MEPKAKNLHQRIIEVMRTVKYVKKNVTVNAGAGGPYKAVSHDAVAAELHGAMADHGIVCGVNQQTSECVDGLTRSGTPKIRYSGWYEVQLINADDPQDRETYRVEAHAEDSGDKAPGKALSYATKMALLKAFMLETGENDEERVEPEEPICVTANQAAEIDDLINESGVDRAGFLRRCRADTVDKIRVADYLRATNYLRRTIEKNNAAANALDAREAESGRQA